MEFLSSDDKMSFSGVSPPPPILNEKKNRSPLEAAGYKMF